MSQRWLLVSAELSSSHRTPSGTRFVEPTAKGKAADLVGAVEAAEDEPVLGQADTVARVYGSGAMIRGVYGRWADSTADGPLARSSTSPILVG